MSTIQIKLKDTFNNFNETINKINDTANNADDLINQVKDIVNDDLKNTIKHFIEVDSPNIVTGMNNFITEGNEVLHDAKNTLSSANNTLNKANKVLDNANDTLDIAKIVLIVIGVCCVIGLVAYIISKINSKDTNDKIKTIKTDRINALYDRLYICMNNIDKPGTYSKNKDEIVSIFNEAKSISSDDQKCANLMNKCENLIKMLDERKRYSLNNGKEIINTQSFYKQNKID